jgi:hypothetical protein
VCVKATCQRGRVWKIGNSEFSNLALGSRQPVSVPSYTVYRCNNYFDMDAPLYIYTWQPVRKIEQLISIIILWILILFFKILFAAGVKAKRRINDIFGCLCVFV